MLTISNWQLVEIDATIMVGLLFLFTFQMVSGSDYITDRQKELVDARELFYKIDSNQKFIIDSNCGELIQSDYDIASSNLHPEVVSEIRKLCVQKTQEMKLQLSILLERHHNVLINKIDRNSPRSEPIRGFDEDKIDSNNPISESIVLTRSIKAGSYNIINTINMLTNFLIVPFAISASYESIVTLRNRTKEKTDENRASNTGVILLVSGLVFLTFVLSAVGLMRIII